MVALDESGIQPYAFLIGHQPLCLTPDWLIQGVLDTKQHPDMMYA